MKIILVAVVLAVMLAGGTQVTVAADSPQYDIIKPEVADLSPAARDALKTAIVACSLYDDTPSDRSLRLRCKQKIETFKLDFGKRYPLIAALLGGWQLLIESAELQSELGSPAASSAGNAFREALEKAYQESLPH